MSVDDKSLKEISDRPFKEQWFCVKDFHSISGNFCCMECCKNWVCSQHPHHKAYLEKSKKLGERSLGKIDELFSVKVVNDKLEFYEQRSEYEVELKNLWALIKSGDKDTKLVIDEWKKRFFKNEV